MAARAAITDDSAGPLVGRGREARLRAALTAAAIRACDDGGSDAGVGSGGTLAAGRARLVRLTDETVRVERRAVALAGAATTRPEPLAFVAERFEAVLVVDARLAALAGPEEVALVVFAALVTFAAFGAALA